MGDERVSVEEVAEAGDILAEEVDVLLERLTDKVLASPRAGSRAWYTQWNAHNWLYDIRRGERPLIRVVR